MPETFNPIVWRNDQSPALNETNLNRLEVGVEAIDDRVHALELGILAPVTLSYATSVTINAAQGGLFRCVVTGDLTLDDIVGGVNGQRIVLEVQASGGTRTLAFTGSLDSVSIPDGQWWIGEFRYRSAEDAWVLVTGGGSSSGGGGSTAPVIATVPYVSAVTLNALSGSVFRITATGSLTIADIANGVDGQVVRLEVLASGADRALTVAGVTITVPSGQWWVGVFYFNAGADSWLLDDGSGSGGAATGGYTAVQDEGTARTARATLNFIGAGVTVTDDAANTRTNVTIPGGGGGSGGTLTLINVKTDYAAAGNGSTNDTAAINNAIAACSAAGGGIVYFPPGTYMTDGGHVIPARVNILGCEPSPQYWVYNGSASPTSGCALKIRSGTAQTSMFTTNSGANAWSIRDITLVGNSIGTTIQGIAPVAPSTEQNSTVENVAVIGFTSHGIGGSWQAARFSTVFVGGCGGYGLNCSGSNQWADIMFDHSFVTGNKLGGLNIDSTASGVGLLNFTDTRFERSGWNPNAINTPTSVGGPGIRIRGNAKKLSFTGCSTDANSGSGLDIDRTSGRFLHNLTFVSCLFCRDGFGNMSTLGEYAGVKVRGTSGNTADYISFANCFVESGLADDGGTAPASLHPKYGLWLENSTYLSWMGGRIDAGTTLLYGGGAGWASNWRPMLNIPEQGHMTLPVWDDAASRPTPVLTTGMVGINDATGKIEFYWGGWKTVTST